jgi:hypothetical protein
MAVHFCQDLLALLDHNQICTTLAPEQWRSLQLIPDPEKVVLESQVLE